MAKAAETAYTLIRAGVLSGEFARGQRLREEQLARQIGVSRTPVREALRRLDAEGLVEFTPNRGARVSAWTRQELEDLYDIRAMLEGHGARLAAARIAPEEVSRLSALAAQMATLSRQGASAADELTVLNGEFHRAVVRASRNSQLDGLVRAMIDAPLVNRTFQRYSPDRMRASSLQHSELVEAIAAGDGSWAESVMRAHILAARGTVVRSMEAELDDE
jgi:DNA-binding GntR family transcriptional regulator